MIYSKVVNAWQPTEDGGGGFHFGGEAVSIPWNSFRFLGLNHKMLSEHQHVTWYDDVTSGLLWKQCHTEGIPLPVSPGCFLLLPS